MNRFRKLLIAFILAFGLMFVVPVSSALAVPAPPPSAPAVQPAAGSADGSVGAWFKAMFTAEQNFQQVKDKYKSALGGPHSCWACKVFNLFAVEVFKSGTAIDSGGKLLSGAVTGFASVFALFYLGSGLVAGDASDLAQRWTVFWRLCVSVAVGTAVLSAGSFSVVWKYIYGPLFSIGIALTSTFGVTAGAGASSNGQCDPPIFVTQPPEGAKDAIISMASVVCGGHMMTNDKIATGLALTSQTEGIFNTLVYIITGIIIAIMFVWIAISFPLRFIDILIRLGIIGAITPFLVIAAVFKPTRGYISIGISNVLNAAATFAITAIMFKIGSQAFDSIVGDMSNANGSLNPLAGDGNSNSVLSTAVVLIGMAAIFGAMLRSVPSIAAELSQFRGSGTDTIGGAASGVAANIITMPIKGAGMAVGGVGGLVAARAMSSRIASETGSTVASALNKGVTGAG